MSLIALGTKAPTAKPVPMELDVLLRTRLLIQANSGGGKSWLLRRLGEQLFGRVPVIIVDPEGEFATLREQHGYVLVGKGGETPADPRSAKLVAEKLLELRASAVCDLFEMPPLQRHAWVRLFLEALMNAPKRLWHPVVVIVDEAHRFAPERGAGESEASEAMITLATDGRKRGYCAAWATQRLAKVRKDASAELLNRLVGPTFEDLDLDRAADLLSILRPDRPAFFAAMKKLDTGFFWGFGRAIALERVLIKIGPVTTTHPEPGSARHAAEPPPAPDKVRALLPKLADLPRAAEEKAKTEAEFRKRIRDLEAELKARPTATVEKIVAKRVEVPILKDAQLARLEKAIGHFYELVNRFGQAAAKLKGLEEEARVAAADISTALKLRQAAPPTASPLVQMIRDQQRGTRAETILRRATAVMVSRPHAGEPIALDKCARAILAVLSQHPDGCTRDKLALLAGYRWSGGFRNALSALRSRGLITGANRDVMVITEAGRATGPYEDLPHGDALIHFWLSHPSFSKCEREILRVLVEAYPEGLTAEKLTAATGYDWSGGFRNSLSTLRTAGVLVGRNGGEMRAEEALF